MEFVFSDKIIRNMSTNDFRNALKNFSLKIRKTSGDSNFIRTEIPSKDKILQNQIDSYEKDRILFIKKQYDNFQNPKTSDIEKDEESLVKAFEIFKSLLEIESNKSDNETFLYSKKIVSPICKKNEYANDKTFSFLKIWFIKKGFSDKYIPSIVKFNEKYFLEFVNLSDCKFSSFEKEILQVIDSL